MGSIIIQIVGLMAVLGLLAFVVRDDRRTRVIRALEDAEELRQQQTQDEGSSPSLPETKSSD